MINMFKKFYKVSLEYVEYFENNLFLNSFFMILSYVGLMLFVLGIKSHETLMAIQGSLTCFVSVFSIVNNIQMTKAEKKMDELEENNKD